MDDVSTHQGPTTAPAGKRPPAVFVERATRQWVVRDPEGAFWSLPAGEDPWGHRRPLALTAETELDPVPGHYKHVLGLPF